MNHIATDAPPATLRVMPDGVYGQVLFSMQHAKREGNHSIIKNFIITLEDDRRVNAYVTEAKRFASYQDPTRIGESLVVRSNRHRTFASINDKREWVAIRTFIEAQLREHLPNLDKDYKLEFCEGFPGLFTFGTNAIFELLNSGEGVWHYVSADDFKPVDMNHLYAARADGKTKAARNSTPRPKKRKILSKEKWLKQNYPGLKELPKWRFPAMV
jgi:hypothetical protein